MMEDLVDLLMCERGRLRPGPDKPGHLRGVPHHVPRLVRHLHLDQDVPGKEPLRADHALAAAHLDDVLGRDENLADLGLQTIGLHALLE